MEAAPRLVNRPAPPVPAAAAKVVESVAVRAQCHSLRVSSPGDAAEVEAQRVASAVVNMPAPAGVAARVSLPAGVLSRAVRPGVKIRAPAAPTPALPGIPSGGQALGAELRRFMEPRFGASFDGVRIHTDDTAARLAGQMQARAFAVGQQIFFGAGQFRPESRDGRELIAHELTHTLQQGRARQPPLIQRSILGDIAKEVGLPDPRDYIAGKASSIRGFDFMTVVIGKNPITDAKVDDSPANLLRQATKIMPGGGDIAKALDNHGIFDRAGKWISGKFTALKNLGSEIKTSVSDFITGIKLSDMKSPGGVWDRGKALLVGIVTGILDFVGGIVGDILDFIKDAILKPIGAYARTTSGYPLLCTVLGKDPITGDKAPQDAEAYLGGFLIFVGENEIWANMKKANAVQKAFVWFKGAAKTLVDFVSEIPTLFIAALKSLTISDILLIPKAFIKLGKVFAGFAGRFISWAAKAAFDLLEIILDSVKPGLMGYIKRTGGALKGILRNPMPFAGNLIAAGKLGFQQFAGNFLTHLKARLIEWLTGALPGVYIPAGFELKEIVKFVLSVLGISWANVRIKLVKVVGEPAVKAMETGFDIVVTLVRDGPAAAWDKIKEQLGNLKDMVIGGITSFVVDMVVKKAVPKIIAMFIPGAGFISAAISIYESVMVFVQKLSKIAAVVGAFVNSIVQIAAGNIGGAAKRVESVLAGLLSLAISFLAGFAGLGKVADKVMGVLAKVRAPIDKALDALIGWIVGMAKKLFAKAFGKDKDKDAATGDVRDQAGTALAGKLGGEASVEDTEKAASAVMGELKAKGLSRVYLGPENAEGDRDIFAAASPPKRVRVLARKRITVSIEGTVKVSGEPVLSGLSGAGFAKFDEERAAAMGGSGQAAVLPQVSQPPGTAARKGNQPSAGLVIKPEAESQKLEVVAWNTSAPEKGHNTSHAERQFIEWFNGQSAKWKDRVVSVDVTVNGRPICELCASDIATMKARYPKAAINWKSGDSGGKKGQGEKRQLKA
jgi:hypothetical protein